MAGLRVLLEELYNDALNRKVFWHYSMPVDYSTDKVFQGINFLMRKHYWIQDGEHCRSIRKRATA